MTEEAQSPRRRRSTRTPNPGNQDDVEVRIFTIADHAISPPPDGKLYIHGAGVGSVLTPVLPPRLPSIYLVIRLRIPWRLTSEPVPIVVRILDADRHPVAPLDPLVTWSAEVGRPPGARPGDEHNINLILGLEGLQLNIQQYGAVYFHLVVGDQELSVHPLKFAAPPVPIGAQLAQQQP